MSAALPVPRSHGWSETQGIVLLEHRPGVTLRDALADGDAPLPAPAALDELLRAIPDPGDGSRVTALCAAAEHHAALVEQLMPDLRARIRRVSEAVLRTTEERASEVPVHGDFYEAQVLVESGCVTGLIDVDTAGLGHPADDHANLVGHLATWEALSPRPERVRAYARAVLGYAETRFDPASLRLRIAASILGLATGAFRVQMDLWPEETERRIALAEAWVASANALRRRQRWGGGRPQPRRSRQSSSSGNRRRPTITRR